jgi:hypothetical protein
VALAVTVAALVLFATQALLVAAAAAVRPRANIYVITVLVALATTPAAFFADRVLFGRALTLDGRLFFALMHLTLGGFLFHFLTLPDRSVSLRILVEVLLAPGKGLPVQTLGERYGVRTMIASRLRQLADGRFIAIAPDGTLSLEPRGIWFGRFVTAGRRLFRITSAN